MRNPWTGFRRLFASHFILSLAFSGVVMTLVSCSGPESGITASTTIRVTSRTTNPLPNLDAAAVAGRPLFAANCAMCHGENGRGDGTAAYALAAKPLDLTTSGLAPEGDGKMFLIIKNGKMSDGKVTMPPTMRLTDEQIWQIVAHVRTLARN
jgi:mono/diheme cytochrome c family protein